MRLRKRYVIVLLLVSIGVILSSGLAISQTDPTPLPTNEVRPIYTYFPDMLVCSEAIQGVGPTIGLVTIGETTIQDVESLYAPYFDVTVDYFEASGETLIYLNHVEDGTPYQRIDVCVIDDVIVATDGVFRTFSDIERIEEQSNQPPNPASFQYVTIESVVRQYGVPDVVTYSPSPVHRVAFWFEQGIAAEFYVVFDPPDSEYPPAFGSVTRTLYFPYQDKADYAEKWPFNQTFPEGLYILHAAPYVATDVPTERNPFDFDSMIATLTAIPRPPTVTATPEGP